MLKKVKVLHVVGAMNRAGTETMLMNIYRNIDHSAYHFDFVSYDQDVAHYDQEIEKLNGRIIRLTRTNSIKQLYDAIKKYGPYDVVHAHTLFHCGIVSFAAFLAAVDIRIAHAHTTADKSNRFLRKVYITLMRFLINVFSTNLLACSNEAGQYLFGEASLSNKKYRYFPNLIDYSKFMKVSKKEVNNFKQAESLGKCNIVIGHIGTFKASKNHKFLVAIMKHLIKKDPTINMLLIGDGELKNQIEAKVKKAGMREQVKFIGISDNIPTILHSMDVFVFPSIYEGLGLVLLEAQASGIPCIVSEAIQPEADLGLGLLEKVPLAEGPHIWAERIIQVAAKKEGNKNNIINAFEKSGYSLTNGIATLRELYDRNMGGKYEQGTHRLF